MSLHTRTNDNTATQRAVLLSQPKSSGALPAQKPKENPPSTDLTPQLQDYLAKRADAQPKPAVELLSEPIPTHTTRVSTTPFRQQSLPGVFDEHESSTDPHESKQTLLDFSDSHGAPIPNLEQYTPPRTPEPTARQFTFRPGSIESLDIHDHVPTPPPELAEPSSRHAPDILHEFNLPATASSSTRLGPEVLAWGLPTETLPHTAKPSIFTRAYRKLAGGNLKHETGDLVRFCLRQFDTQDHAEVGQLIHEFVEKNAAKGHPRKELIQKVFSAFHELRADAPQRKFLLESFESTFNIKDVTPLFQTVKPDSGSPQDVTRAIYTHDHEQMIETLFPSTPEALPSGDFRIGALIMSKTEKEAMMGGIDFMRRNAFAAALYGNHGIPTSATYCHGERTTFIVETTDSKENALRLVETLGVKDNVGIDTRNINKSIFPKIPTPISSHGMKGGKRHFSKNKLIYHPDLKATFITIPSKIPGMKGKKISRGAFLHKYLIEKGYISKKDSSFLPRPGETKDQLLDRLKADLLTFKLPDGKSLIETLPEGHGKILVDWVVAQFNYYSKGTITEIKANTTETMGASQQMVPMAYGGAGNIYTGNGEPEILNPSGFHGSGCLVVYGPDNPVVVVTETGETKRYAVVMFGIESADPLKKNTVTGQLHAAPGRGTFKAGAQIGSDRLQQLDPNHPAGIGSKEIMLSTEDLEQLSADMRALDSFKGTVSDTDMVQFYSALLKAPTQEERREVWTKFKAYALEARHGAMSAGTEHHDLSVSDA